MGATENARHENAAQRKMQGWKCSNGKCGTQLHGWKMRDKSVWKANRRFLCNIKWIIALCRIFQSCIFQPCIFVPHFPVSHFPPLQKPAGLCRIFQSCIFMSRIFSVPLCYQKSVCKQSNV